MERHQLLAKFVELVTIKALRRSAYLVLWGSGLRQERLSASAVSLGLIPETTCHAQTANPVNTPKRTGENANFAVREQFRRRKRASALCARLAPMLTTKTTNASPVISILNQRKDLSTAWLTFNNLVYDLM